MYSYSIFYTLDIFKCRIFDNIFQLTTVKKNQRNKQSRYDKRLILKIVKEVENGLPRKEANRIYGLGKASLDGWMRDYGSPEYQEKIKRRSYTKLQKRTIITAIEQGRLTIKEAKTAHNIKNNCNLIEADGLKTLAFKIELAARRENQAEARKYASLIKKEFEIYMFLEH